MEKYAKLFELSKYVVDEDVKRSARIDDKASKYFSVLTLFFGVLAFVYKWSLDNFVPFSGVLDYIGMSSLILFAGSLAAAWYFSFKVLKLHELLKMPMNEEMIKFFDQNRLIDIHYALSKNFAAAYKKNKEKIDNRSAQLAKSYKLIICSLISGALLFSLIAIETYNIEASETHNFKAEQMEWQTKKEIIIKTQSTRETQKMIPEK